MTRTEDLLDQINAAVEDWETSEDAMRCAPAHADADPESPGRWQGPSADLVIVDEAVPGGQARQLAREVLAHRLVTRHGLTRFTARRAVLAAEAGRETRHTHLVHAEAQAAIADAMECIRARVQPVIKEICAAFSRIGAAIQAAKQDQFELAPPPARRPDRPAWQSPYGPPQRRRR